MKPGMLLVIVGGLLASAWWAVSGSEAVNAPVEIAVLNEENWDRFVSEGKEVDAIYGDVVLRNRFVTAVIARPVPTRNANMTVRDVAGCLIDFTDRTHESDQLSCFYPHARRYPFHAWSARTSETSIDDVDGLQDVLKSGTGSVIVTSKGDESRPAVEVEYRLSSTSPVLEVITRWKSNSVETLAVTLEDDMRADGGKEDMKKIANGVADWYWFEDRYWGQAYGFRSPGRQARSNSDSRRGRITWVGEGGSGEIALSPGESFELRRELTCGPDRLHVAERFAMQDGGALVPVTLSIWDGKRRPIAGARVTVRSEADGELGVALADGNGDVRLPLSTGKYQLAIQSHGVELAKEHPLEVVQTDKQAESVVLSDYVPGTLVAKIVGENGKGIPCKVQLIPQGDVPTPDFGPETAEFAVRNLRYAPHGEFEQDLMPGTYRVVVSHGPEFDALFEEVVIEPAARVTLEGTLVRSVDTPGWISSDFHSHSSPSGDNTASQLGRVLNLVCEHLEFSPCTEHNRISTYVPHMDKLKIHAFMSTCSGMELTGSPLPLNHQNSFPLHHHPHEQDGGGPVTDSDPAKQIERLALWDDGAEKLIQQNHPDIGWLFYDQNGDGEHDDGYARTVALIDVMEIHPVERLLALTQSDGLQEGSLKGNRIFRWLQLLNQGYRIPGVVNTDAHYNFHGSGWLRNWIQCSTDDAAKIDPLEIVRASEEGRVVMSNGPYLEVLAQSGETRATAGEDLEARDGRVALQVRVQCPNWLDIDTVALLVNGRLDPAHHYTRAKSAEAFGDGTVKFDRVLNVHLKEDSHLVVIVAGENFTLGEVMGPNVQDRPTAALANPIFVDVDGGGFAPNKDRLGHELPVKGR